MKELKYEYLLPIGSIVKLKESERLLMIIGVLQNGKAYPDRTFDYVAVPYPQGIQDSRMNLGFDHNDIEEIIFRGFENDDRKAFLFLLEAAARVMEKKKS